MRRVMVAAVAAAFALAGCGTRAPVPEWQMEAHGALARYTQAWLTGADRVAEAEFTRARAALASTGRADLVARAELVRCAVQVASLALAPGGACEGFEALRDGAAAPERAYAAYLAGGPLPASEVALLPPAHQSLVAGGGELARVDDPLARLVAAGVRVRAGRGSPDLLALAAETASQQGWRRPLMAWLGAQARLAQEAGRDDEAQRLRRRIALVAGEK